MFAPFAARPDRSAFVRTSWIELPVIVIPVPPNSTSTPIPTALTSLAVRVMGRPRSALPPGPVSDPMVGAVAAPKVKACSATLLGRAEDSELKGCSLMAEGFFAGA